MTAAPRVLLLDNRDSFVFNLAEEFLDLGAGVRTVRSGLDGAALDRHLQDFDPDLVVLSPGPGRPEEGGLMVPWLATRPDRPVLGVCLGLQAMVVALGGAVGRAPSPVHGRATAIDLGPDPLFEGLPRPFPAARYHSLVATSVPAGLRVIAEAGSEAGPLPMAVRHVNLPWIGLQFHPESILTTHGAVLLRRILAEARTVRGARP